MLAVAGSAFYRGAALLAAEGALRTGAGIVTLASVEPVVSAAVTRRVEQCPNITVRRERVEQIDESAPILVATGPLTDGALADEIGRLTAGAAPCSAPASKSWSGARSADASAAWNASYSALLNGQFR